MLEQPETRYARNGDVTLAYQVVGDGPLDLIEVAGFLNHLEVMWEEPGLRRYVECLARFARVILFDRRGVGLSDRVPDDAGPSLEDRVEDVRAVLDAAGSRQAVVLGVADGGPIAIGFAARHPARTRALVLHATGACSTHRPDYPIGIDPAAVDGILALLEQNWGRGAIAQLLGDDSAAARDAFGRFERRACTPRGAVALTRVNLADDVRDLLPALRVPTLVVHHTQHPAWPFEGARYMAAHIPGAKLLELANTFSLLAEFRERPGIAEAVEEFVVGVASVAEPTRALCALVCIDIVDSTGHATRLGDRRWRDLLDEHDRLVGRAVDGAGGRIVSASGDGLLARFDGAVTAVRCARAIVAGVTRLGLAVRAGVHVGDCEIRGDDLAGIAVHVAARVMAAAAPGEVLATTTVRDLVLGSGLAFVERGHHALRGVPGDWLLLAAT